MLVSFKKETSTTIIQSMKAILGIVITVLVVSFSCSSQKNNNGLLLQITKKRCLGKCPVYDLYLYENGKVLFVGIDHVEKKGKFTFNANIQQLKKIDSLLQVIRTQNSSSQKFKRIRDLPVTVFRFDHRKMEFHNRDIPKELKQINEYLEKIVFEN